MARIGKIDESLAEVLINAWEKNALYGAVRDVMPDEFRTIPGKLSLRVIMGRYCKTASDALWDGRTKQAKAALLRVGFDAKLIGRFGKDLQNIRLQLKTADDKNPGDFRFGKNRAADADS